MDSDELVMLPFLPPSPVSSSNYANIVYDQAALVASFNSKGQWKPIDIGHALLWDGATPAQGWVVELAPHPANPAHTGAWCLMTARGRQSLDSKEYGFTSPTFLADEREDGLYPTSIHSLSLTNTPACYKQLLAFSEGVNVPVVTDVEVDDEVAPVTSAPADEQPADATVDAAGDSPAEAAATVIPAAEAVPAATAPADEAAAANAVETALYVPSQLAPFSADSIGET